MGKKDARKIERQLINITCVWVACRSAQQSDCRAVSQMIFCSTTAAVV
jgi:hypothetical protein